ncbi:MAG TPA: xanthine dehydrogenase family protein subunit M [Actinomycetota bacterium]
MTLLPPRFDYASPDSLDDALSLLEQHGNDAKVLAGGQSLIPLLKLRFASPALLVDVNRIAGLDGIQEASGQLRIGALARHASVASSETLKARYPILTTTAPLIADPITRGRGTMGGSLAHADPAGDWGSVMLALGASVVARSATAERTIAISDFFRGPFRSALMPNEMVTEIRIPSGGAHVGGTYLKLERKVGDFATVGVAVVLDLSDGGIDRAGIGLTAVGSRNLQATAAQESLVGVSPSPEAFDAAAALAAEASDPSSDVRGSAEYKRAVVRAFVRRGLDRALEIAQAGRVAA